MSGFFIFIIEHTKIWETKIFETSFPFVPVVMNLSMKQKKIENGMYGEQQDMCAVNSTR